MRLEKGQSKISPIIINTSNTSNAPGAIIFFIYKDSVQNSKPFEKEGKMKVRVDSELCVGDGTCVEICPEIFEMPGDVAVAKIEQVSKDLEGKCKEAAESCPVEAILIEE
jgi:ferredoxin